MPDWQSGTLPDFVAREGRDPLRMSHWTFLPSDLPEFSVKSCRVITISFVFLFSFSTDFRLVNSVVSLGSV